MDCLIIGGTGLISSEITRQLADRGHGIIHYNRGTTDADVPECVETIHGDRTDYDRFEEQVAELDVDCVIDMWAMDPGDVESVASAFGGRIEQYVLCSTVDVYQSPPRTYPHTEDLPLVQSGDGYAPNKAACERTARAAARNGAFETTIIRPGYTYGPEAKMLTTFGFGTGFVGRIRAGKPVVVHGDGTALWSGCHRDDVAQGFANAVGNDGAYGESYHLTSDQWVTWNQFVDHIAHVLGAPDPDIVHIPTDLLIEALPDEKTGTLERVLQYSFYYDNSKARRDLAFEQTVPFLTGVERALESRESNDRLPEDDAFEERVVAAWTDGTTAFRDAFEQ